MITSEVDTLVRAMLWGMILAFEYDCIRILRRVIKHYHIWTMSVEDIIFWINVGFTVFAVTYDANDGIVRGFLIGGFVVGALVFRGSVSSIYVRYVSRLVNVVLKMLKRIFHVIKMFIEKHFYRKSKENL